MSNNSGHAKSKEYIRPMPSNWWTAKRSYRLFMLRELTCVFVGGYALFLLLLVALRGNEEAFTATLHSPLFIALQIIALPMVLYHTITWINLTPKVVVVWLGEERVSSKLIAAVHYAIWVIVSIVVFWLAT